MISGWRTRLYHWSLDTRRVAFAAVATLITGFVVAVCIVGLRGSDQRPLEERLRESLDTKLASAARPARVLAEWVLGLTGEHDELEEGDEEASPEALEDFLKEGRLMGVDLRRAIQVHGGPQDQQALFADFIVARLGSGEERAKAAWRRIEGAALRMPPAEFANEFLGALLVDADKPLEALNACRREGEFSDARHARATALRIALDLKEKRALRELLARTDYREAASGWLEYEAGSLLGDWVMHVRGLVRMEFAMATLDMLLLALLSALFWYAVFQRFLHDVTHRWLWGLPLFLAGMASIPLTFFLIRQQESLGFVEDGTFPNDLLFFVFGVGLREELAKLALFALALPWLLRRRSASAAMLAGALVGLGFAFEENISYYAREGHEVVIGRLLTANFMHAAMTSILGYALYELARTRFGSAEKFLLTFLAVVVAHGIYDYAPRAGQMTPMLAGGGFLSFVILALLAHRFFDELAVYVVPRRGLVTMLALFLLGVSGLISLSMVLAAWSTGSLVAVSAVGMDAAGLVPIAVLYVRRFSHG